MDNGRTGRDRNQRVSVEAQITLLLRNARLAYPQQMKDVPDQSVAMFVELLKDLPIEALDKAVVNACRSGEFYPSVAAIRKLVAEERIGPIPVNAWRQAVGGKSDHVVVQQAITAIGGRNLRTGEETKMRPEFERKVRELYAQAVKEIQVHGIPPEVVALPQPSKEEQDAEFYRNNQRVMEEALRLERERREKAHAER